MALLKCKMCGGTLTITPGNATAACEYCGTTQTIPKVNDDVTQNLFNRANELRIKCEFDRAEQTYEKILELDNNEAEAHWGLLLCRYGIEYVTDPMSGKKIPTCHRTSYESILTDVDYQAAIDLADPQQKELYLKEAKQIDTIQKNILQIANNEDPFDVFLCYKETDEHGKRTVDSVIANDIYYQLIQEGYKVFYAPITLEDKLGSAYEPYIFAALNSAKVMLVIGTKPEYFNAVWVKNEWGRFLHILKKDRSKLLIPCYRDMDPYDLPDNFSHLQSQDMSKIGFINDVVRGIKKVIVKEAEPVAPAAPVAPAEPAVPVAPAEPDVVVEEQPVLPEGYRDNARFTKLQWVLFIISSFGFVLLNGLDILNSFDRFTVSTALLLLLVVRTIAILVLTIRTLKTKKKDIPFFVLSALVVYMSVCSDSVGFNILTLILLLLSCGLYAIPVISSKLSWIRFFFWIPALIPILGSPLLGNSGPAIYIYIICAGLLLFMLSVVPPLFKKSGSDVPVAMQNKVSLKNGITMAVITIILALTVPTIPARLVADHEFDLAYSGFGSFSYAIDFYEDYSLLSEEKLLEKKYEAATYESTSRWDKLELLEDLALQNYRDAKEIYEETTEWHVTLDFCNTNPDNYETNLGYAPQSSSYLHMGFNLSGGKLNESIDVTHSIQWPNWQASYADWDWEDRSNGSSLSFEYSSGLTADSTGSVIINFYNKETGELIDSVTIPVR